MLLATRSTTRGGAEPDVARTDLHTLGVAYLVADPSESALGRAVASIERAAEQSPGDAALHSDLAAAYLVSAQRRGEPYDLVRSLTEVEKALEIVPDLPEALFNRALVLEKLFLATEAKLAWLRYQKVDPESDWSREATARAAALDQRPWDDQWKRQRGLLDEAGARGDQNQVEILLNGFHQPAREYAQEELLPHWADAVRAGRDGEAVRLLGIARTLGNALARRTSDAMIRDTVAAIDATDGKHRMALVEGLRAYRDARRLYMDMHFGEAEPQMAQAAANLRQGGGSLAAWADLFAAICVHFRPDYQLADRLLGELSERPDLQSYPALRGRILYNLGITRSSQGDLAGGLAAYRQALPLYELTGEIENLAAVRHVVAENLDLLGQPVESWKYRYLALSSIDRIPNAVRRRSLLVEAAEAALRDGQLSLSLHAQNELIRTTRTWVGEAAFPDSLLQRSQTELRLGSRQAAWRDLDAAESSVRNIRDPDLAQRLTADRLATQAELEAEESPGRAHADVSEAIRYYERAGFHAPLIHAYRLRARISSSQGDAAEADLLAGITEYESRRAALPEEDQRISYFDQARSVFDDMVLLQVDRKRQPVAALDFAERSRSRTLLDQMASLPAVRPGAGPGLFAAAAPLSASELRRGIPGTVALVEYALIGRRLFTWVVRSDGLDLLQSEIDPAALRTAVGRMRSSLTGRSDGALAEASRLYEILFRPLEPALRGRTTLVLVPDGVLYRLPFAALFDSRTSRFLTQSFRLAIAPSASAYLRCLARERQLGPWVAESILAVGNPTIVQGKSPELPDLPAAEREATAISTLYPRATTLLSSRATSGEFLRLSGESDVVHFAGHAQINESFPLLSTLLLSPEPGAEGSGPLFAFQIYRQKLHRTRLVVLAACSTAGGQLVPSEGPLGLARSFLAAGAPAVVASLTEVDDSAPPHLFNSFHRHLRAGAAPARALQAVQREEIERAGGRQTPWAWAAFELIGGAG
jgi:CHAT domain-containing protein